MARPALLTPFRLAGLATLLLISACATATPSAVPSTPATSQSTPPAPVSLVGTAWELETLAGQPALDNTSVTARFADKAGLSGSGGCNRYTGRYVTSGDGFMVEGVASPMMACDTAIMTQETAFLNALKSAKTFAVAGDKLTLSDASGALVVMTRQSQELAGSAWTIWGYNNGKEAVVSLATGTTADLTFAEDGSVSGTAGCNRLMGTYTVDGEKLTFGPLAGTKMMCAEPAGVMEQEAAILKALESTTSFSMDGDKLRLMDATGATSVSLVRS